MANRQGFHQSGRTLRRSGPRPPRGIFALMAILLTVIFGYVLMQGKVVRVVDGDTITVLSREGSFQRIRLYGIDCPEAAQGGGKAATDFTRQLALYQAVRLSIVEKDAHGRSVALAHLPDGRLLNEELVRAGHAWVYRRYCLQPFCLSWQGMEQEARNAKRGLWAGADPQPPWLWRQQNPR